MSEEMPDPEIDVMTITLHRASGGVEVNFDGLNYLEAIGMLTVAMHQVQETPFYEEWSSDDPED